MEVNFTKKIIKYIEGHYISRFWVMLADILVSVVSTLSVYVFATYFMAKKIPAISYLELAAISAVASLVGFYLFKTHRGILRHTTFVEVWRGIMASIVKCVLLLSGVLIFRFHVEVGLQMQSLVVMFFLDIIMTIFLFMMERVLINNVYGLLRSASDSRAVKNPLRNVLIYGDDDNAVATKVFIEKSYSMRYRCVGFIASRSQHSNSLLCGLKVYELKDERAFSRVSYMKNVKAVIFSSNIDAKGEEQGLIPLCAKKGIMVLIRPTLNSLDKVGSGTRVREIKIEDLLGRDEIKINLLEIRSFLTDKTVVVTGGAGSIGGELARLLVNMPIRKLILIDTAETPMHDMLLELRSQAPRVDKKFIVADVRSLERIDRLFAKYRPNVVFHAAAYKHVPMMESNPTEAVFDNVFGTKNMVDISIKYNVEKFVMISTDKAVNPANVMGASKRIAEMYVQSMGRAMEEGKRPGNTKFVTTRFGNVLGSNGSVIPLFKEQIAKGGPVTVTDPRIIRYFMTIPEACRLVLEAAAMGQGNDIFVFDMGEPVKIDDLAKKMIALSGLELGRDIAIEYVGLRPGEKLYEELLKDEESTLPTVHERIFRAKVREYDIDDIDVKLEMLRKVAMEFKKDDTVAMMKKIVPEFKSENSRYGRLDA